MVHIKKENMEHIHSYGIGNTYLVGTGGAETGQSSSAALADALSLNSAMN